MKPIFNIHFKDINELNHSIIIYDTEVDDPTATPIELTALSPGYTINWSTGISNIITPGIISSLLEFSVFNNNSEFTKFLNALPYKKENQYIVRVTTFVWSVVTFPLVPVPIHTPVWVGILSLDFSTIQDNPYSIVKMNAVDGVALLKSMDVELLEGEKYERYSKRRGWVRARQPILKYIIHGLQTINSSQLFDIDLFDDKFLYIRTDWFDSDMPNDPNKDPLDMVSMNDNNIDFFWHEKRQREGYDGTMVVDVEKYSIYELIENVMIHFNCILLMNRGRWFIVQRDLLRFTNTMYRIYTREGDVHDTTPNETLLNNLVIEQHDNSFRANGQFSYLPGLKRTRCTYLGRWTDKDGNPTVNVFPSDIDLDVTVEVPVLDSYDSFLIKLNWSQWWWPPTWDTDKKKHYKRLYRVFYKIIIQCGDYYLLNAGDPIDLDLYWVHKDSLKDPYFNFIHIASYYLIGTNWTQTPSPGLYPSDNPTLLITTTYMNRTFTVKELPAQEPLYFTLKNHFAGIVPDHTDPVLWNSAFNHGMLILLPGKIYGGEELKDVNIECIPMKDGYANENVAFVQDNTIPLDQNFTLIHEIPDALFGSVLFSKRNMDIWTGDEDEIPWGWYKSVNKRKWSKGHDKPDKYYFNELLVKEVMKFQNLPRLLFSGDLHLRNWFIVSPLPIIKLTYRGIVYSMFFNEVTYTAQTNQWSGEWIELNKKPDHESLPDAIIEEKEIKITDTDILSQKHPLIDPELEIHTGGILISGRTNFGTGGIGKSLFRPIIPVNEGVYRINSFGKDLSVTSSKGQHLITLTEKVIQLGILYNYHSLERLINGFFPQWRVPDLNDVTDLLDTMYLLSMPTGSVKSTENEFWESPNSSAMNLFGLNIRGGGIYVTEGRDIGFQNKRQQCGLWVNEEYEGFGVSLRFNHDDDSASIYSEPVSSGLSVRLVRDADSFEVGLPHGTEVEGYTGNDGMKYRAVKIGTLIWITENLAETISNDGQPIPFGDFSEINWNENACVVYNKEINNLYKESLKTPVYVDREFLDGDGSIYRPISLINLDDNKIYGIKNGKLVEITGGSGGDSGNGVGGQLYIFNNLGRTV